MAILTFRFANIRKPEDYGYSFSKWSNFTRVVEPKRDKDSKCFLRLRESIGGGQMGCNELHFRGSVWKDHYPYFLTPSSCTIFCTVYQAISIKPAENPWWRMAVSLCQSVQHGSTRTENRSPLAQIESIRANFISTQGSALAEAHSSYCI